MFHNNLSIIVLGSCILSTNVFAQPCDGIEIPIVGEIHTLNETYDDGDEELTLTGTQVGIVEINEGEGTIYGEISNQTGVRTILNHVIDIDELDMHLMTYEDVALSKLPAVNTFDGVGCEFNIFEAITNMSGTYGGQPILNGTAFAEGTVNFCPESDFMNHFTITGSICTTSP